MSPVYDCENLEKSWNMRIVFSRPGDILENRKHDDGRAAVQ